MTDIRYLLFLICIISAFPVRMNAAEYRLCPNCQYSTLEALLPVINDCDTIYILGGEYHWDNVNINRPSAIIGIDDPVIFSKEGIEIFTVTANDVIIEGITFKNVKTSYLKEHSAIRIKESRRFGIYNNRIDSCFFGIYLQRAREGEISGNILKGNATTEAESGNGIHAWHCNDLIIKRNEVVGHRDGIYLEFVDNSIIHNNISDRNKRYGLHFMFSNDDIYRNNIFRENGVGVAVMFSRRIQMLNNDFIHNWGSASYGLLLKEIYDAEINNNVFYRNTMAIFVEGSNRIIYEGNDFERNGWAIKFSGGCEDNEITGNNFLHNSLDLVINTKLSSNTIHHNYWSNYSGYDLDKDQIGDIPYYPVKLFYYIIEKTPEAIVLMRSLFVDLINFAEKVSPVFTPKDVYDPYPLMKEI